jgi:hypothetical protein
MIGRQGEGYKAEEAWQRYPRLRVFQIVNDPDRLMLETIHRESGRAAMIAINLETEVSKALNDGAESHLDVARKIASAVAIAVSRLYEMSREGPPETEQSPSP